MIKPENNPIYEIFIAIFISYLIIPIILLYTI